MVTQAMLEELVCQNCATALELQAVYEESEGEVAYGVVGCQCSQRPVIDGILCLRQSPIVSEQLELLERGAYANALALSLSNSSQTILQFTRHVAGTRGLGTVAPLLRLVASSQAERELQRYAKASPLFGILRDDGFGLYLRHRFSSEALWPLYAMLPMLKETSGMVLDLGCGVGHGSFLISKFVKPTQIVCADSSFWLLFLAKRFMVRDASYINLDANFGLPFADGALACVLALDMIDHVEARASLVREFERATSAEGLIALLHVGNALCDNFGGGRPLSPKAWFRLFRNVPMKAFAESNIVHDLMLHDRLDLSKEYTMGELEIANALSLIATSRRDLLRAYEKVSSSFVSFEGTLRFNPAYRLTTRDGLVSLTREWPTPQYAKVLRLSAKYLHERIEFPVPRGNDILQGLVAESPEFVRGLMRRFVVLNVPPQYL